jgi:hypothetical protein
MVERLEPVLAKKLVQFPFEGLALCFEVGQPSLCLGDLILNGSPLGSQFLVLGGHLGQSFVAVAVQGRAMENAKTPALTRGSTRRGQFEDALANRRLGDALH